MKKLILSAVFLLCAGCAVHADDTTETYTATVIESDGECAVLQLDEAEDSDEDIEENTEETEESDDLKKHDMDDHKDGTFRFCRDDEVLIIDDDRMVSLDELHAHDKTVVTFGKGKAVVQLIDEEESPEG